MYGEFAIGEAGIGETVVLEPQEKDFNCFKSDGEVDLSVCRKVGFKNVQARKAWHGTFGFNSEFAGICYNLSFPPLTPDGGCTDTTCGCLWEPYQPNTPTNKYLNWEVSAHQTNINGGVTTSFADIIRQVAVNRWSGCQTVTECSDSYSDIGTFLATQAALTGSTTVDPCSIGVLEHVPANGAFNIALMLSWVRPIANLFATGGTETSTRTGCEPIYSCETHDTMSGTPLADLSVDATAGTADYHQFDIDGNLLCEIHIAVTETTSFFQVKARSFAGGMEISSSEFNVTNTLSGAYTSAQLYADLRTLLNQIDMSDDNQYPWRVDGYISIAPFMTFDEAVPTIPNPSNAVASICPITAERCQYSGNMVGGLLPAGYGPNFAWNHRTFRCCTGDSGNLASYIYAYGAWAKTPPESPIPPYTFTTCPPAVCSGGQIPVVSFSTSGHTLFFKTNSLIPGWTGAENVTICGTNAIDGIYFISGPTGTGPYEYSVIGSQVNDAPFLPGCAGGVVGVVNVNTDATFYTAGDPTDLAMPGTATQWTENVASVGSPLSPGEMPSGGWLIFTQGYLYGQKWAEIKVHRPSYNFARPCGTDKWMLDETKVTCVESSDGLFPPTLEIFVDIGLVTNDLVYVCGVTEVPSVSDGVYKVTVVDGTHVKLSTDCTMRRIQSATQNGINNVDIVLDDAMDTINNGDSVDIVGVPGLGAGLTVTLVDERHFSVFGTLTSSPAAGGYAFVSGSKAYQIAPNTIDFGCGTDANGIIGKIRLQNVPGICGRLSVTSATQQGSAVIILTGTHYLAQGDKVDFSGVPGLGTGVTAVVIDSTSFMVSGTLSGVYSGGGFVSATGGAAYQWDDDQSKGNFLYADFEFNFRDYLAADFMCEQFHGGTYTICGEPQTGCNECSGATPGFACIEVAATVWESEVRQFQFIENGLDRAITGFTIDELCLPFDPCAPQIMAVVPVGSPEDFAQPSTVANFPATFVSDFRYGSRWQGFYVQQYPDLLAQKPHPTCAVCDCEECIQDFIPSSCPQVQDDGSCAQDTCQQDCTAHVGAAVYYAHFPEVEALQDIPDGAPTPIIGNIGFPTYEMLSSEIVDPTWPRLMPPSGPGYAFNVGAGGVDPCIPVLHETPWTLAIKQWTCVCDSGRFAPEYLANGQTLNCPP